MDDPGILVALPHLFSIRNHTLLAGVWLASASIAAAIADVIDRSAFGFFALGLLIGPLAIVAAVLRPSTIVAAVLRPSRIVAAVLRPWIARPPHNVMTAAQAGNGSRPLALASAATDQQPTTHNGRQRTGSDLRCEKFLYCSNLMFCRASPLGELTVRPTSWPRWRKWRGRVSTSQRLGGVKEEEVDSGV